MRLAAQLILVLFVLTMFPYAKGETGNVHCDKDALLTVDINPQVKDFSFWENFELFNKLPHISANLHITNTSDSAKLFSTANALLVINEDPPIRAYLNTIASAMIDFYGIEVQPKQTEAFNVYWPVDKEIGTVLNKYEITCKTGKATR